MVHLAPPKWTGVYRIKPFVGVEIVLVPCHYVQKSCKKKSCEFFICLRVGNHCFVQHSQIVCAPFCHLLLYQITVVFRDKKIAVAKNSTTPQAWNYVLHGKGYLYQKIDANEDLGTFFFDKKFGEEVATLFKTLPKTGILQKPNNWRGIALSDITYQTLIEIEIAHDRMQNNCWTKWV